MSEKLIKFDRYFCLLIRCTVWTVRYLDIALHLEHCLVTISVLLNGNLELRLHDKMLGSGGNLNIPHQTSSKKQM